MPNNDAAAALRVRILSDGQEPPLFVAVLMPQCLMYDKPKPTVKEALEDLSFYVGYRLPEGQRTAARAVIDAAWRPYRAP